MLLYPFVIMSMENADDRAFMEKLYRDYHRLMYAKAFSYVHNAFNADDIVNDACVALINRISLIRELPCNSLRAYIVTTVKNISINRLRDAWSRRVTMQGDDEWAAIPSTDEQPEQVFLGKEQIEEMLSCVYKLSERDQALLQMRYYLDMDDREIGRALGIKPDTVRPCLTRARNRVRKMMREAGDSNE